MKVRFNILCVCVCLVTQLCLTLCDPMDCSLPCSSVHGDSPGKNTSPGDFSDPGIKPRSPTLQADALPSELPGKPLGQRSMAGYSPWGSKELDTTEQLR